ncbi:hypothetical protein TSAR_003533 [Trichomalopsis sarcophagae]|uniref:Odorant receptor n=1 Tax=Trichomalopsis sarcophagae TaxID=543379 RepID=A0A232EP54_9HYME|nr:hypothetical protein TSAR_003533 [Trichomalopsis sarcophagae]
MIANSFGLNFIVFISFTAVGISILMFDLLFYHDHPFEKIILLGLIIGILMFFFVLSWIIQKLTDSSEKRAFFFFLYASPLPHNTGKTQAPSPSGAARSPLSEQRRQRSNLPEPAGAQGGRDAVGRECRSGRGPDAGDEADWVGQPTSNYECDLQYSCHWYSLSVKAQKLVYLLLMRTSKTTKIRPGGLIEINIHLFESVSYSVFDGPYYWINKNLLDGFGLWSETSRERKFMSVVFFNISAFSLLIPTVKLLYKKIAYDWKMLSDKTELDVLLKYSRFSKMITMIDIYYALLAFILILFVPVAAVIMDQIILLKNGIRIRVETIHPYYFDIFDVNKYYYYVHIFHVSAVGFYVSAAYLTLNSMHVTCIQHVRALFAVACYRIEKLCHHDNTLETSVGVIDNNSVNQNIISLKDKN